MYYGDFEVGEWNSVLIGRVRAGRKSARMDFCPDWQSARMEFCPDQQNAHMDFLPEQQNSRMEFCPKARSLRARSSDEFE